MAHVTRSKGQANFELTVANRTSPSTNKATSSPFPLVLDLSPNPTLLEVKKAVAGKIKHLKPERQRFTTEDKRPIVDDEKTLSEENVKTGDTLWVKDLGPQVAWRTVFLTEYAGPLFIHPIFYFFGPTIWRKQYEPSNMQTFAFAMVMFHYAKREYETLFVHRFSNGTMPIFNIFKNSAHYWILSGVFLAVAINSPWYGAAAVKGKIQDDPNFLLACLSVWAMGQAGNLWSHLTLMNLRPAGTKKRKIPRGGMFEVISCPNYFFETITWTAYTILTLNPASFLFAIVSVGQMAVWAQKKHRNYRREFKDYPRGRKAMFPFVF